MEKIHTLLRGRNIIACAYRLIDRTYLHKKKILPIFAIKKKRNNTFYKLTKKENYGKKY